MNKLTDSSLIQHVQFNLFFFYIVPLTQICCPLTVFRFFLFSDWLIMTTQTKLRQSHAIVFTVFQTVFLRCFGVAFHPLPPTLVKENFFTLTDYLFCFRDIVNYIIYIYTRFQKGFHIERYMDRYILLFSCTCARVHFSLVIVQLVKNSTINFFFVGFFFPIWKG